MKGYFDYNGTVPFLGELKEEIRGEIQNWINHSAPVADHEMARRTAGHLDLVRGTFTGTPGLEDYDVVFTSGATESNRLALEFLYQRFQRSGLADGFFVKDRVLIFSMEHGSVLQQARNLRNLGYDVLLIPSTAEGMADIEFIRQNANDRTALISVMAANGETGVLQPVAEVGSICLKLGIHFHCDAVQIPGRTEMQWYDVQASTISLSGHKFGGLPGAGLLFHARKIKPEPLFFGNDSIRPGTPNIAGILSMERAWHHVQGHKDHLLSMRTLRTTFETELLSRLPQIRILGWNQKRLENTTAMILPGISPERLLRGMTDWGIQLGILHGSQGLHSPSPVVLEMGQDARGVACRVSLWKDTTTREMGQLLDFFLSLYESGKDS